jgi:hypothetical protein
LHRRFLTCTADFSLATAHSSPENDNADSAPAFRATAPADLQCDRRAE